MLTLHHDPDGPQGTSQVRDEFVDSVILLLGQFLQFLHALLRGLLIGAHVVQFPLQFVPAFLCVLLLGFEVRERLLILLAGVLQFLLQRGEVITRQFQRERVQRDALLDGFQYLADFLPNLLHDILL